MSYNKSPPTGSVTTTVIQELSYFVSYTFFLVAVCIPCHPALAEKIVRLVLPNSVSVEIVEGAFDTGRFKIEKCNTEEGCLINGYPVFGVSFDLPKTYVKEIKARIRGKEYDLDTRGMFDAWGDRPLKFNGGIRYFGSSCSGAICLLQGIFSDGAGTFVAEWMVTEGRAFRTIITDDSGIIELFKKNIDAEER
jgi:hypothetical protein